MIVGKAGLVVVIPVPMIAKYADHDTAAALIPLAMFERDIHGFLAFVGPPKEAVFFIGRGIGDGRPYAAFLRRRNRRLLRRKKIGGPRVAGRDKQHAYCCHGRSQSHFGLPCFPAAEATEMTMQPLPLGKSIASPPSLPSW